MSKIIIVTSHLSKCEHCLFPNERDCYEFLCGVSESTQHDQRIIEMLQSEIKRLRRSVKVLEEANAYLRAHQQTETQGKKEARHE